MLKILAIDDSKSIHAFLRACFQNCKIEFRSAFNGEEALEVLKNNVNFDLILLDWEMPIKNGPETLKAIKDKKIDIKVVMMTSKNSEEDIDSMISLGAVEYIMKPFTKDILFGKIEMVLDREISRE